MKTFTAVKSRDRNALGERVTEWIARHPELTITDKVVRQSSDERYHCLTIVVFYQEETRRTR
jgi:putative lipoic acid-binding regulatory protein